MILVLGLIEMQVENLIHWGENIRIQSNFSFNLYLKNYLWRSILEAESRLVDKLTDKELERDIGNEFFIKESLKLAVGDDTDLLKNKMYATVQVSDMFI